MPRVLSWYFVLCLLLLSCQAFGENSSPKSVVEVAYVLTSTNVAGSSAYSLLTYNIDSDTGAVTLEGSPLHLYGKNVNVIPSPDDRYLYVLEDDDVVEYIRVFATDSLGVPRSTPIQTVQVAGLVEFEIDPTGTFAFGNRSFESIQLFTIDPRTGFLSPRSKIDSSPFDPWGPGSSELMFFAGFNPNGSELFHQWEENAYDWYGVKYFRSSVDASNGELGAPQEVFEWSNSGGDGDVASFSARWMIVLPYEGYGPAEEVDVYPMDGSEKPLIACTAEMLPACGEALSAYPDPAGQFLFLQTAASLAQIARIDSVNKTIVDTGYRILGRMNQLSPDRRLAYAQIPDPKDPGVFAVYLFNPQSGFTRRGGSIQLNTKIYSLVTAVRRN